MRKTKQHQEQPQHLKQKLMSALSMFLVATILMTSTTFAWLVMSTAPEVTGITTNVGANGSLEIALLNAETYTDLAAIRTGVGTSAATGNPEANNAWGNLVDLGYQEYGLSDLLLLPSRLMVGGSQNSYSVDSNLLAVPVYGYDGRVMELEENTVTAIYQNGKFVSTDVQDYGVRAVGTSDSLSPQGSALKMAKSTIPSNTNMAKDKAKSSLSEEGGNNGSKLITMIAMQNTYSDNDLKVLQSMINYLKESVSAIEGALRQGLIAYAASGVSNQETFKTVRDQINAAKDLTKLVDDMGDYVTVPADFVTWVSELDGMDNDLNAAQIALNGLSGGSYTRDEFRTVLDKLMNIDGALLSIDGEDRKLGDLSSDDASVLRDASSVSMILQEGSGIYADLADFAGNYSVSIEVMNVAINIITVNNADAYLSILNTAVQALEPADGGDQSASIPLDATYGYAIDLAFRCNAADPDLRLQTSAIQRIYSDSEAASTQGGGSYMAFSTKDKALTQDRQLALMDALRVTFVDVQGNILAVAKPNITSHSIEDGMLKAPLYLYDFTFEPDENGELLISFGERRKVDNLITDLDQNVPKAVTAVVWLDGDIVDNTMVSATEVASLNGVLNLQFSTSAKLIPGEDANLFAYEADLSPLEMLLNPNYESYNTELDCVTTYAEGMLNWTTVSWNDFVTAYDRAMFLYQNKAGEIQAREAALDLAMARMALEPVSKEAIDGKIAVLRELMGSTDEASGYVVENELHTSYTEAERTAWKDAGVINSVDYTNNNLSTEEGIQAPIYTDGTWANLASSLYYAEYISMKENATSEEVDEALTQLENAEKALEHQVAFIPYEYQETIYYKVAGAHDDTADEIYGDWYDSNYNRIYSEVTMLLLDSYAEPVTVMDVKGDSYLKYGNEAAKYVTINAGLLTSVYPELRDAEIKGIVWDPVDSAHFVEMMNARHNAILTNMVNAIKEEGLDQLTKSAVDITTAEKMLEAYKSYVSGSDTLYTAAEVNAQIDKLEADMEKAREFKATQSDSPATETQRTLLNVAVATGQNYITENQESTDEAVIANVQAMTAAVDAAQQAVAREDLTYRDAKTALKAINNTLSAAGLDMVSEKNSIVHQIPGPAGSETVVYDSDYTDLVLKVYNSGTTTLKATILTKDGVVNNASKEITIYDAADGVKCYNENRQEINEQTPIRLQPGETTTLTADIYYKQDQPGVIDKTWKDAALLVRETPVEVIWASENPNIVSVDENGTITTTGGGATSVSVSIRTLEGNTYVLRNIPVLVYIPADGAACYNADGEEDVPVTGIAMNAGDSVTLTAKIQYPESVPEAYREKIVWYGFETDNAEIIGIGGDGTITALTGGDTRIHLEVLTNAGNIYSQNNIAVQIPYKQAVGVKFFYRDDNGDDVEITAEEGITLSLRDEMRVSAQLQFADNSQTLPEETIASWGHIDALEITHYLLDGGFVLKPAYGPHSAIVDLKVHTVQGNVYELKDIPLTITSN